MDSESVEFIKKRLDASILAREECNIILESGVLSMGLFSMHLAFEKLLKVNYVLSQGIEPPKRMT